MSFENVEDVYVLSPMQQGILFHTLYAPHSGAYTSQTAWALNGALTVPLFRQSWQYVVDQHPILRTSFVWEGLDKPLQIVHQRVEVPWEQHNWCDVPADEQGARWEQFLADDRTRGFPLDKAPLMRLSLFQLAEDVYRFIWSYHHLLLDGWSYPQVLKEVLATYDALCRGQRPSLEHRRPYRDYIAWLQEQDLSQAEAFWRQTLKGFTAPTRLTVDQLSGERPNQQESSSAEQELIIAEETTAALQAFARGHQLTLNTLVQGAWALLLSHYSQETDLIYGTVVSGRPVTLAGVEAIIGLFVNTLPVRVQVSPQAVLLSWLKELQRQQVELRQYEYSPLMRVQGWSTVPRGLPLFETILAFENYPLVALTEEKKLGLTFSPVSAFTRTNYPLELIVVPRTTLALRMSYDCERFDSGTISRMLGHFQNLLVGMLTHAAKPLSALSILSTAERQLILNEWNVSSQPTEAVNDVPRNSCVHQLVEAQVERTPTAIAIVYEGEVLTYSELNRRANQLAYYLQQQGVGPEIRVGVYLKRSLALIVSLLAVLKAGGAYVPLDPTYPAERLAYMLSDAQMWLVLTQQSMHEQLPQAETPVVCLDSLAERLAQQPVTNVVSEVGALNLAYVMYTSGSTGQPKGVAITHRSIVNLVYQPSYVHVSEVDVFLQLAPAAFDVSTFEIWSSLVNGARLVVAPADLPSLHELAQLLYEHQVSVLWLTAGLFHQMVELELEGLRPVKQLLAGGEALSVPHVRQAVDTLGECQLINGYGPTENTTFSCCYAVQRQDTLEPSVPIGRPIAYTQAYVLNEQLEPVPMGVLGELYLGGEGLARGYLKRPELTAERFVPHPFSQRPGARLYRTGDLVRAQSDGTLLFGGRRDGQIKLRGYRIECGEIESWLVKHAAVQAAVVLVREDRPADKRLVAYLVRQEHCGEAEPVTARALRQYLQARLPEYMVPAAFVWLDALPLTANGKVDRQALPLPQWELVEELQEEQVPRTPTEEVLAELWAEVLGVRQVSRQANFFELGGHSLLATQLVSRIWNRLQINLPLQALFEAPTLASLADALPKYETMPGQTEAIARLYIKVKAMSAEELEELLREKRKRG